MVKIGVAKMRGLKRPERSAGALTRRVGRRYPSQLHHLAHIVAIGKGSAPGLVDTRG